MIFSIDQNCHSLWDVLGKLHALARHGRDVTQFVEDVDVAFTELGSPVQPGDLRIMRERYYRGGGADWGAAVFYSQFLGRLPVDIRRWEPLVGMTLKALAGRLGASVDHLYDEYSPGDNWQLVGPSYVGDRNHHRLIGDLSVGQTHAFLRQIMGKARADCMSAFPAADSQSRLADWFDGEQDLLESLIARHASDRLVNLYRSWLGHYLGGSAAVDVTSRLLALPQSRDWSRLVETFIARYDLAAELYNQSLSETQSELRPLDTQRGELPFFAVLEHHGHLVRTGVYLEGDKLCVAERTFRLHLNRDSHHLQLAVNGDCPYLNEMKQAGIWCLSPKAILLIIQARLGPTGAALAVPYRGSSYLPASHRLAAKLVEHGLLQGPLKPLLRVRFRMLDRMAGIDTPIRLPHHLAWALGGEVVPARRLGQNHRDIADDAARRLDKLADPSSRAAWQRESFPVLAAGIAALDARRRELAPADDKNPQLRDIWKRLKALQLQMLRETVGQIARDWQLRQLDYWDSRGALLPWCIGLGGQGLYNDVVQQAEIYEEHE